ncbi:hypothetical protein FRC11_005046, partial [Ceratobasidium sp. 423]
ACPPVASDAPDIPPPVDERPVPLRPASAPTVVNVKAAEATIPQPNSSTETPAVPDPPDTTPIITNVVWTGLRATLQGLGDNSGGYHRIHLDRPCSSLHTHHSHSTTASDRKARFSPGL